MTVQDEINREKAYDVAWFRRWNEKECEVLSDEQIELIISLLKSLAVNVVARHTSHIPHD